MKYCLKTAGFIFFLGIATSLGWAQEAPIPLAEGSNFSIEGSSTLHDWKVQADEVEGSIDLPEAFTKGGIPSVGTTLNQMSLKVAVAAMDGGKEVMNGKMHRALKKDTHPHILYELTSAKITAVDEADNSVELASEGQVTIAGVTQPVTMTVKGALAEGKGWKFTGSHTLNMTDYNIEPPTAMFGQIVTGDEVTVAFSLYTQN